MARASSSPPSACSPVRLTPSLRIGFLADSCGMRRADYEKEILPRLKKGEKVLVAAHGNSLRA